MTNARHAPARPLRGAVQTTGFLALFVVLTVWHTWPLGARLSTHMQAGQDPKTMMWSLLDLARNLVSDPLHLMDGSAFYPHSRTIAVVDHQLTSALFVGPLGLAGLSGVTLFNLVVLASFALSGVFTSLLVHRLTRSWEAAVVSGIGFAFATSRVAALPHLHVLSTQWLPLALWALHRYLDRPTWGRWVGLAGASLLVALTSWHGLVIGGVAMAVVVIWTLAPGLSARRLAGLALVATICAAAVMPLAAAYLEVAQRWPPTRDGSIPLANVARSAVHLGEPLLAMPDRAASPFAALLPRAQGVLFPGVVLTLLALPIFAQLVAGSRVRGLPRMLSVPVAVAGVLAVVTGLLAVTGWLPAALQFLRGVAPWGLFFAGCAGCSWWLARRRFEDGLLQTALPYAALTAAGAVLALGPRVILDGHDLGSGLWRLDLAGLPLMVRDPSRFGLLAGLGVAVLAGHTVARWCIGLSRARAVALVVLAGVALNLDLAIAMPELRAAPAPSGVDRWLRDHPQDGAVVEFPVHGNYWAIYASQEYYGRRNVDGRGFLRPPGVRALRTAMTFEDQIRALWEHSRPRYVVLRGALFEPGTSRAVANAIDRLGPALELRSRDGEDAVYELFDREVGDQIVRRWPLREPPERDGLLVLAGRFDPGVAGTRALLTVSLNGTEAGEWTAADLDRRSETRLALPRDLYVAGENVLRLSTRYTWLDEREANPVGQTGVGVRADVRVTASARSAAVLVNGALERVAEACWVGLLDAAAGRLVSAAASSCLDGDPAVEAQVQMLASAGADTAVIAIGRPVSGPVSPRLVRALENYGVPRFAAERNTAAIGVRGGTAETIAAATVPRGTTAEVQLGDPHRRRFAIRGLEIR